MKNNQVTVVLSSGLGHWAFSVLYEVLYSFRAQFTPLHRLSKLEENPESSCLSLSSFGWGNQGLRCYYCCCLVSQWYPTPCNSMDCSLPGSSIHGILQARILEWVAIPFSKGPSRPRDGTQASWLQADSLPSEPPEKPSDRVKFFLPLSNQFATLILYFIF